MLKILVTGSNGQLGSQLRQLSLVYPDIEFMFTDLPELDITNQARIEEVMSAFSPEWLINCAAYTAVDKAETDVALASLLNIDAPALLAKACTRHHVRMVHISTDYVFNGEGFQPYTEDHPKAPKGVYGNTKASGEDLVLSANPEALLVRTAWLYSIYGANFVKTILRLAREKGTMRIVSDQVGTPTWAGDLAVAILTMIKQNTPAGIYHFSNEGVCSWYDFAKAIVEIQGMDCIVNPTDTAGYPVPAPRPFYSVLDKTKYKTATGQSIPYWRESLKQCLQQLDEQSRNQ
ncbi:MAG: dTDP-4-dehydrorhamnose reductase [Lentimicrobiaceae bacterium]